MCGVMSQSHSNKGLATDEVFQEQCVLCEREASVDADFNFHGLSHAQEPETLKETKKT